MRGPAQVEDFCIGPTVFDRFMGQGASTSRREALVVAGDTDNADIGLYLDANIVTLAQRFVARQAGGCIDSFCVAVEGVSHFVYLTFCGATLSRPVSQIELELQAEIDKFVMLRALFGCRDLVHRLFTDFRIDERLSSIEQARYRAANQHGQRYARWLDRLFERGRGSDALEDARRFYRMPLGAKLARIALC